MSIRLTGIYYNPQDAAEAIGCSKGRVCQMVRSGEMSAVYVTDKMYLIPEKEVERVRKSPKETGRPRKGSAS